VIKRSNPLYDFSKVDSDIKKWCALMEIMHIASLAHDDIVDDSPSRRGQQSQHLKYGSKVAVFSGNYIISKA
jgi:geranylgeranyl pyrophosphate synthase